jgi:hypothetical protein
MSVSNLLNPETKNEEWSKLYCNKCVCEFLFTNTPIDNPITSVDNILVGDIQPTAGTSGTIDEAFSTREAWDSDGTEYVKQTLCIDMSNVLGTNIGTPQDPTTRYSFDIEIGDEGIYPPPGDTLGSVNVVALSGNLRYNAEATLVNLPTAFASLNVFLVGVDLQNPAFPIQLVVYINYTMIAS